MIVFGYWWTCYVIVNKSIPILYIIPKFWWELLTFWRQVGRVVMIMSQLSSIDANLQCKRIRILTLSKIQMQSNFILPSIITFIIYLFIYFSFFFLNDINTYLPIFVLNDKWMKILVYLSFFFSSSKVDFLDQKYLVHPSLLCQFF